MYNIFFFISEILKKCVSGTMDGKRCACIMVSGAPASWFAGFRDLNPIALYF
jgi:hypothetical protein